MTSRPCWFGLEDRNNNKKQQKTSSVLNASRVTFCFEDVGSPGLGKLAVCVLMGSGWIGVVEDIANFPKLPVPIQYYFVSSPGLGKLGLGKFGF